MLVSFCGVDWLYDIGVLLCSKALTRFSKWSARFSDCAALRSKERDEICMHADMVFRLTRRIVGIFQFS